MSDVRVIEYEDQGTWVLGLELNRDANAKAQFINQEGKTVRIHPQRITRRYSATVRLTRDGGSFLSDLAREVAALQPAIDLCTLWELVQPDGERMSVEDLCDLALPLTDLPAQIALFRSMREKPMYFRINKDDTIVPREPETVSAMLVQEAQLQSQNRQKTEFVERVVACLREGRTATRQELTPTALLDSLRGFSLSGDEETRWLSAAQITTRIAQDTQIPLTPLPLAAFTILQRLGVFGPLDCPAVCSLAAPEHFPPEVLAQAQIATQKLGVCTTGTIVTIDDEETRDIDDAVSLVTRPDGCIEVRVHIADPGAGLEVGSPIETEARVRATSIYLPTRRIPMMPETISEFGFSLIAGEPRAVLTYVAVINPDGEVVASHIEAGAIRVSNRLSYDEADASLGGSRSLGEDVDLLLRELLRITRILQAQRVARGAIDLKLPEAKVRVNAQGEISIKVLEADSPSRAIVSECMILANTIAGRTARAEHLNVIYRTQKPPESPLPMHDDSSGMFQLVRKLKKGELSCHPGPHFGLGVDVYLQASSPLRRYSDLLASLQIRAWLLGLPQPFEPADLMPILGNAEAVADEVSRVERKSTRYWLLEALARRSGTVTALVLESSPKLRAQVLIEDMALRVYVQVPRVIPVGERMSLRVTHVDPLRDQVVLDHVQIL
ncbi:RNB domain-containing ribonuclease [Myxococcota bacterium]|nr:RNB domain-containing ribonuclease [Myxococcota bacterium]